MALKAGYFIRESAGNLRRNPGMTLAAVLTVTVSLFLLGGVLTLGGFIRGITGTIEKKVEVSVFLRDSITPDQQKDIQLALEDLSVVRSVDYVSKDEAFKEFKELYRDQPVLYENIDASVLPASFRVAMKDPKRVDLVKTKLAGNPGVEEVADQRETVGRLVRFTSILRTFSSGVVAVLFITSTILIVITIQLAIFSRRREIEIMKLVGATNWFVRIPFLMEGIVQGFVGAVVALVLLIAGKTLARALLPVWIPTGPLHGADLGQIILLLVLGTAIGAIGSAFSMRKYLDA